jgi:hypothetical protein
MPARKGLVPCSLSPALLLAQQKEVKAATSEVERLVAEGVFQEADCALLHGQMAPDAKEAVLQRFKRGDVKVLVRWARLGTRLVHHLWQSWGHHLRFPQLALTVCSWLSLSYSTTVVEVGVDVPQATIMVIEHAGRGDRGVTYHIVPCLFHCSNLSFG